MKDVTYRGRAKRATITDEQWKAVGVDSASKVWEGYGSSQEVADEAADYLAKYDDRFEVDGAGDDSAYAKRLRVDTTEQITRQRFGTRGGIAPDMQPPTQTVSASPNVPDKGSKK